MPTNDQIINLISGKLSLFSVINDKTNPQQFKDEDIMHSFQKEFKEKLFIKFDKIHKKKFLIVHSQC